MAVQASTSVGYSIFSRIALMLPKDMCIDH
jgi:hypothetical protein